jgi:hypothetical protein
MEQPSTARIAKLEEIVLLQQEEKKLQSLLSSPLSEVREKTQIQLAATLEKLSKAASELMRLQQGEQ